MALSDVSLFNVVIGLLMVVFGFLLNRVFSEIDKLAAQGGSLAKQNGELKATMLKDYVGKDDYLRHIDAEERSIERMGEEIGKRFDKLDILIEAIRVKQQT